MLTSSAMRAAQAQDIDFFAATPFPSFDVISMGMILHDWGIEKKKLLMRKVRGQTGLLRLTCWQQLAASTRADVSGNQHLAVQAALAESVLLRSPVRACALPAGI